jgi:hypothetical protein
MVALNEGMFIPSFVNIGQMVQKSNRVHKNTQPGDIVAEVFLLFIGK